MRLRTIEQSQVAWLFKIFSRLGSIYWPDAVRFLQDVYKFVKVPSSIQELDARQGIAFLNGRFLLGNEGLTVDSLRIYNDGFIVETKTTVEQADLFASEVMNKVADQFKIEIVNPDALVKAYESRVEIQGDFSVLRGLDEVAKIISPLKETLQKNKIVAGNYVPTGMRFYHDAAVHPGFKPAEFVLERRAGEPFSANVFYSVAPTTTSQHLALLEKIEQLSLSLATKSGAQ